MQYFGGQWKQKKHPPLKFKFTLKCEQALTNNLFIVLIQYSLSNTTY